MSDELPQLTTLRERASWAVNEILKPRTRRGLRAQKRLGGDTLQALADAMDVHRQAVERLRDGITISPRKGLDVLTKLLDLPADWLARKGIPGRTKTESARTVDEHWKAQWGMLVWEVEQLRKDLHGGGEFTSEQLETLRKAIAIARGGGPHDGNGE